MKKIFALLLCICMLFSTVAHADAPNPGVTKAEYEVWTQSPSITCGITSSDMTIYKSLAQNLLQIYPLTALGDRYYLAICTEKITDGGWSGKTKTSYHDFFTLYAADDSFIILGKTSAGEEYYWDRGFSFANISSKIDGSYYQSVGSEKPCYVLCPQGKYTNSNYDEYDEYFFITDKGNIHKMSSNAEYGCEGYPYIKDGILYRGQNAYRSSSSTKYYYMPDSTIKASNSTPLIFNGSSYTQGTAVRHNISEMTSANGYSMYTEGFSSNVSIISGSAVSQYLPYQLTNVFPDGRYVTASWMGMGNGLYELWYNIYNSDGTLRATGPTGYSGYFGSVFDTYDLIAYAVNNSKFIVCLAEIGNSFLKEYYRYAVLEESDTGEISTKVQLGDKKITPPNGSDTEVVQDTINFGDSELPLGYNIKNNVIDSGKLDAMLRDQVNSVRLNDIVILAKEGYQSGEQNTGVTLSSYSNYDYSFGSAYVRLYTNGQYFRWYCYYPEDLTPGTYSKTLTIGDKTVYVTFKIVDPPTNEGSTTVVF